jgi:hypothetical protein
MTGIAENQSLEDLPGSFLLHQNYPNPFNPDTRIDYELPAASNVKLTIFNLLGQKVRTLVDEYQLAGARQVTWDGTSDAGKSVATGLYLYRLQVDDRSESKKMLLLK